MGVEDGLLGWCMFGVLKVPLRGGRHWGSDVWPVGGRCRWQWTALGQSWEGLGEKWFYTHQNNIILMLGKNKIKLIEPFGSSIRPSVQSVRFQFNFFPTQLARPYRNYEGSNRSNPLFKIIILIEGLIQLLLYSDWRKGESLEESKFIHRVHKLMAEIYPLHQSCQLPTEDQATPSSMVSVRVDGHDAKLQSTV